MPLFTRRKAQREKAAKAAMGEAVALGLTFDDKARTRLLYAIGDSAPNHLASTWSAAPSPAQLILTYVHRLLVREWGETTLADNSVPHEDMLAFVATRASDEQVLDVIEATFVALEDATDRTEYPFVDDGMDKFRDEANRILDEHDIAYQVVGNAVVPRSSMVMHADVVEPALSLLHGDGRLSKVEKAFRDALRELKPEGSPTDAITDAGTALQEMLSALGCHGNSLGPMLDDARRKDLLGPHDSKLAMGVENIGDWVSADRSERGDAHGVKATDADDAWLAVHVVGALVLRLAKRL